MATPDSGTQEPLGGNNVIETSLDPISICLVPPQPMTDSSQIVVPRAPQLEDVLAVAPFEWADSSGQSKEGNLRNLTISQDAKLSQPSIQNGGDTNITTSRHETFGDVDSSGTTRPKSRENKVRKLYRHECGQRCCPPRWSEFTAPNEEQNNLEKKNAAIPILHFHTYNNKQWVTSCFMIQSRAMKNFLILALYEYQDLDMELENWTFNPPYMPLVHRWHRLKELQAHTTDPINKHASDTLMEFLTPILTPPVNALLQTRCTGKVNFDTVWQIFPPGELVISNFYGAETICRALKYEQNEVLGEKRWTITTEYVDWNGESCGYVTTETTIRTFGGFRRVTSLPVYPLSFKDAAADIKSKVIERGRKFELLRGYHFVTCDGKKVLLENEEEKPVSGRVVIDAFAYYKSCNIVKPDLRSLFDGGEKDENRNRAGEPDEKRTKPSSDADLISEVSEPPAAATSGPVFRCENLTPLTDEHCLLATPWLKGFDLKTKEWAQFHIDDLKEISWNDAAFENLVLPDGEKELVWAFTENKNMSSHSYDDFVHHKGRGILILMFGPPGVGKTYTAEAVAERSRVPLFSMSAGMLGTDPEEIEESLDRALELCPLWNAMLLLDEADVFLSSRTNDGLARNELVSIFLTKLEYYKGILFLTTNLAPRIDHAFQSRIDLFLPYFDLTTQARRQVWGNFINHVGREKFDICDDDLENLSQLSLNGREIKNIIKCAQLLSSKSGGKVPVERLHMLAENRVKALKLLANG